MSVLSERVCRTIERYRLLPPGARVVAAVSGGADSTALACLLLEIAARCRLELAGLAHFNHNLRGAASDEDESFCAALAGRLGVPCVSSRGDVRTAARELGASLEDAGRRLRYTFLEEAREKLSATHVAVGHTRDDQAETLLLNLLRGAGTRGLGGMPASRGTVVRPLLDCSHGELVAWLDAHRIPYREDESNRDNRFHRNRVRHEVMPAFERAFPGAARALARSAVIARADADYLEAVASDALAAVSRELDGGLVLDAARLCGMPPVLARRVARSALIRASRGRYIGIDQAQRLVDLAAGLRPGPLALPGVVAEVSAGMVALRARQGRGTPPTKAPSPSGNSFRAALSIPGEALLGDGRSVSSDLRMGAPPLGDLRAMSGPALAVVDAALCSGLGVRYRRWGDRFRPLGLGGHKTLQDFFVDRKVPREERGRVPLVVNGDDRIVWVVGHALSADFRVSDATRAVVILKLRGERV